MKIKNTFIQFILLSGLIFSSCVTDFGNYDYQDPETVLPVTISGIKDTTIKKGEYLIIKPEVTIVGDTSKYTYSWYVLPVSSAGGLANKTVWSNTKNLNQQVTLAVNKYYLNFTVTDSIRDIYVRKEIILTVEATDVGVGWFVLKDIDGETDFDYMKNDTTFHDVLLTLAEPADSRLKGKAVKIEYQQVRYSHQVTDANGKASILNDQSVYHILSDEDIKVVNAKDLKLFKNQQDVFFVPTVCRPQNIRFINTNQFLVNDGKISSIYGMMNNIGKFTPKAGNYTFHSDLLVHGRGGAMGFDIDSRTFYHVDAFAPSLTTFRTGKIPLTNMDATLLNILTSTEGSSSSSNRARGFAVMKNIDKEEYYLVTLSYNSSNAYPVATSADNPSGLAFDTIPQGNKMPLASVKAAPYSGNFLYFADDNKLSVYRNATGLAVRESLLKEFPKDETISYITNVYKEGSFNYLAVLTNNAGKWKLYLLNIIGLGNPEFEDEPARIYQGTGNARYLMYRRF